MSPQPARVGPDNVDVIDRPEPDDAAALARRVSQVTRGAARAAVLGVSDGLVTNICLILAMTGANASATSIRLAGFASLLAGALSMAAGEWVSVRSQVELYQGLVGEMRDLVDRNPELVLHELAGHLEHVGFGRETAQVASTELPLDEDRFLRFTARTLFGLDTEELGSPMTAAVTSLVLFALGAFVPLAPWIAAEGFVAEAASVAFTVVASLAVGAYVSRSSRRSPLIGALRQLLIVGAASAATFGIGALFGTVTA